MTERIGVQSQFLVWHIIAIALKSVALVFLFEDALDGSPVVRIGLMQRIRCRYVGRNGTGGTWRQLLTISLPRGPFRVSITAAGFNSLSSCSRARPHRRPSQSYSPGEMPRCSQAHTAGGATSIGGIRGVQAPDVLHSTRCLVHARLDRDETTDPNLEPSVLLQL